MKRDQRDPPQCFRCHFLNRIQLFISRDPFPNSHVRQFNALQSVLVEFVEINRKIENSHQNIPLAPDRPVRGLGLEPIVDELQAIFGRERIKRAITKSRQQMDFNDVFGASQIDAVFDPHRLPIDREEFTKGRGGDPCLTLDMIASLDLGDRLERLLLSFFLGQVVAEQRPVSLALPAVVQIERQSMAFRGAGLDRDVHKGPPQR
ncbi:MAG: hypothetical protein AB1411_09450 [Nitrospirota bacterium]